MFNKTPEEYSDYGKMKETLSITETIVNNIESQKKSITNNAKLLEIQNRLIDCKDFVMYFHIIFFIINFILFIRMIMKYQIII